MPNVAVVSEDQSLKDEARQASNDPALGINRSCCTRTGAASGDPPRACGSTDTEDNKAGEEAPGSILRSTSITSGGCCRSDVPTSDTVVKTPSQSQSGKPCCSTRADIVRCTAGTITPNSSLSTCGKSKSNPLAVTGCGETPQCCSMDGISKGLEGSDRCCAATPELAGGESAEEEDDQDSESACLPFRATADHRFRRGYLPVLYIDCDHS